MMNRSRRMPPFRVMLVTPDPGPRAGPTQLDQVRSLADEALRGGVDAVQLRAKALASGPLFALASDLARRCGEHGARLIVNDRLDVAVAAGAAGVQLGESALPIPAARDVVGRLGEGRLLIGASVHDGPGAAGAAAAGADYLIYGNVYETQSKPGRPGRGLGGLAGAVRAAAPCPVIAIGGVRSERAGELRAAGAAGIAAIGAIAGRPDPAAAARELVVGWREAGGQMEVKVNDESVQLTPGATIGDLLRQLGVDAAGVAVVVNAEIIDRKGLAGHRLHPGDVIELVSFVGGGA